MSLDDQFADFALHSAIKLAKKSQIDQDTAASIAGELAVKIIKRFDSDVDRYRMFVSIIRRRLVADTIDELRVFGPTSGALRLRKFRREQKQTVRRESSEILTRVTHRPRYDHVAFMDQFERDPELLQYVLLVAAGYTQKDLIQDFGYTRTQINKLKERFEDVYEK
jgi:hypothetical protein